MTYRDEIVIYRVIAGRVREARRFLRQLKDELKDDLKQEEIWFIRLKRAHTQSEIPHEQRQKYGSSSLLSPV